MKRTLTSDELIYEISEVLAQGDGEFIAEIANQVLVPEVTYDGDSLFTQEVLTVYTGSRRVTPNAVDQRAALADTLNRLVRIPALQDLTVCRMAQRDLNKGDIDSALARLRVDADKIRPTCRELYDIINANAHLSGGTPSAPSDC